MAQIDGDEIDALAGQYVLGTLDADERRAADARLVSDTAFRAAVAAWQSRLQPLADAAVVTDVAGHAASCGRCPVSIMVFMRIRSASISLFGSAPNTLATA